MQYKRESKMLTLSFRLLFSGFEPRRVISPAFGLLFYGFELRRVIIRVFGLLFFSFKLGRVISFFRINRLSLEGVDDLTVTDKGYVRIFRVT
ncbi:hypothetical protein BKP35_17070 [Anaerobacillus arseniciselenatis]|uniref:Uncharacterized protein n=1 Tax=Anaerobacillus arseniciselenatis TaxID=85682 RepID=A0A1S2L9T2_9BACI|nr:hypothetical protein [Anaerobacillus arseniciselenatis]OIJ09248.1 hypothetical protein BKP35_17070 [Anaerobacillus arseniciselenatis]